MKRLMNTEQGTSQTAVVGVICLIGLVFIGVFGLVALNRDISQVVYFIGPTLVALAGLLVQLTKVNKIANETDKQTAKIDKIDKAVNGNLDAKFKEQNEAIAEMHSEVKALSNQVKLSVMNVPDMEGTDQSG